MKKDPTRLLCSVSELSDLFADSGTLDNFLQKIVGMIAEHMHSEVCSVYLYYSDSDELVLKATKGLKQEAVGKVKLKIGEGLTGLAVKEMRAVCVKNASRNPQYRYFPETGEEKYESFLAVPILRGQNRIGAVVVQDSRKNYFTDEDAAIFWAITSQLATTIETTRLLITLREGHLPRPVPTEEKDLKVVKGRAAAEGFAFGEAVIFERDRLHFQGEAGPAGEYTLEDFHRAVEMTEHQLTGIQKEVEERLSDVASLIFTAQILMLKDRDFVENIVRQIEQGIPVPAAVSRTVLDYVRMFESLPTDYLSDKKHDVLDIGSRLLENLTGRTSERSDLQKKILVARELYPSDILKFSSQGVSGIILLSGGITSHLAILARSLQIPMIITGVRELLNVPAGTKIIMDAEIGTVFVNPGPDVTASFAEKEKEHREAEKLKDKTKPETLTKDGQQVQLLSNINLLSDLKNAIRYKAEGIGLYRTEFPFMVRSNFPSEEEQIVIYSKLFEMMPGREVTFRTLDIGGDKVLSYYDYGKEQNPFLGMRSIRFSLKHKEVFAQQIRAILRAGHGADLRIMFPMISSLDEFTEAKNFVHECIAQLKREKQVFHEHPRIGMMVELPAAVEIIDDLAAEADFFSIGTNDFIQYMLAVDRTNEKVADLYLPHHPSVLRAFKKIVDAAVRAGIEVSVCGDMAQEEKFVPYFLGIGLRKFSIDPSALYKIQLAVGSVTLEDAREKALLLLSRKTAGDIKKLMG